MFGAARLRSTYVTTMPTSNAVVLLTGPASAPAVNSELVAHASSQLMSVYSRSSQTWMTMWLSPAPLEAAARCRSWPAHPRPLQPLMWSPRWPCPSQPQLWCRVPGCGNPGRGARGRRWARGCCPPPLAGRARWTWTHPRATDKQQRRGRLSDTVPAENHGGRSCRRRRHWHPPVPRLRRSRVTGATSSSTRRRRCCPRRRLLMQGRLLSRP
mmetsp:Transcript_57214/g.179197  ORF Transcript_57214/g.179197 Transcript_57214/m.179197 type:complete len:212 (-) Transcript_57214:336-971(-)